MPRNDDYDRDYDDHDPDDDRPKPRRRDDFSYGRYDEDEYDDYDDQPQRPSRKRAREKVALPAIFLMIVGGLGILGGILNAIVQASGVNDGPNPFINQQQANDPNFKQMQKVMKVVAPLINLTWGGIVLFGAIQMKRLNAWGFVMFSCIWAMLPCSECCLFGIPFGIWGLVTINNESVKRYF